MVLQVVSHDETKSWKVAHLWIEHGEIIALWRGDNQWIKSHFKALVFSWIMGLIHSL